MFATIATPFCHPLADRDVGSPLTLAITDAANSGSEVSAATMVRPMITSDRPSARETHRRAHQPFGAHHEQRQSGDDQPEPWSADLQDRDSGFPRVERRLADRAGENVGVKGARRVKEPPMSQPFLPVTTERLQAFADAWNRHDADALMSFMTDDCVFESSAGPEVCGTRSEGREAVRGAFAEVWATFPDAHWSHARHFVCGDRGVSEWTFTGTRLDGTRVEVNGCDLFTFREGRIALKNSYRKNRPPVAGPKG